MEDIVIQIKDLTKEYKMYEKKKDRLLEVLLPHYQKHKKFEAISQLNLEVRKGEILGILGKNGAGKSTLLKMITGVATPTRGSMQIDGKISSLLELGTAFNMELTGLENIYQNGQVMGFTKEEMDERKQKIIDFADIGEHLFQPVKTYSSGMFARLAFACAINVEPDILIVDEVLSVGDMAFQLKCFKKFEEFKEKGKTILFVTHSISDVMKNCTRAIILNAGKKIFDGEVKQGVEKYKKIIVGLDPEEDKQKDKPKEDNQKVLKKQDEWKVNFVQNPNMVTYGDKRAEVIDYGVFDEQDKMLTGIENDKIVVLKSKVTFFETVQEPIFTMTIKDFNGIEMGGTNSMYEGISTGTFQAGDTVIIEFKQKISLAPGKYTLSFSCTHINAKGDLEALSRKYDALLIEVISSKQCVGYLRLDSKIKVQKI